MRCRGEAADRRWGLAVVRGRSMLPTLRDGDVLLVRYSTRPRVGRLAVVRLPGGVVAVKRVTRRVPVNGPGAGHGPAPAVDHAHGADHGVQHGAEHGAQGWWVERDNPDEGVDSWTVGEIRDADVLARAYGRVWPPHLRLGPVGRLRPLRRLARHRGGGAPPPG